MASPSIQRVRIYLSEHDLLDGQARYLAILEQLLRMGATGATALRGVAGFGSGRQLHSTTGLQASPQLPIVIEWIDRNDRVTRLLGEIDALLLDTLITIEDVHVHRALLRSSGPFGEAIVGDYLNAHVLATRKTAPLREILPLLLARQQLFLPVLDEQDRPIALLNTANLAQATRLALPLPVLAALPESERLAALETVPNVEIGTLNLPEALAMNRETSVTQATHMMLEWGWETLLIQAPDGRFAGTFGVTEALACTQPPPDAAQAVRDAVPEPSLGLLMQRAVVSIPATTPTDEAITRLLASPEQRLVVINEGIPIGEISAVGISQRLTEPQLEAWLNLLRQPTASVPESLSALPLESLVEPTPPIAASAPRHEVIQRMLAESRYILPVVDPQGKLVGQISRTTLLRSLAQESNS